jgi:hypothetical protein
MEASFPTSRPAHRSRELFLLLLLVVGSSLALIVIDSTPLSTEFSYVLLSVACLLLIWVVVAIRCAVLFLRFARRRSWRLSVIRGILLTAVILACFSFLPFLRGCNYVGGALRFAANRSYYDHQVSLLPADDKPRIKVFSWGGMIWSSRALVYDESDEVALPPGQQSVAWKDNRRYIEDLTCGNWNARALWAHYFIVDISC